MKVSWVCFAKPPIKGFVKTRLAKNLGEDSALQIYSWLLSLQCSNLLEIERSALTSSKKYQSRFNIYTSLPADLKLTQGKMLFKNFFSAVIDKRSMKEGHQRSKLQKRFFSKLKIKLQQGNNLGQKMENCIVQELKKNDLVVLWGSDVPFITSEHLLSALEKYPNCSITPVADGGYCLISITKALYEEGFMNNIPWSHEKTLQVQLENMKSLNMSYKLNEKLYDIDIDKDLIFAIKKMTESNDPLLNKQIAQLQKWFEKFC